MEKWNNILRIWLLTAVLVSVNAGERIIFEGEDKLNLPKKNLDDATLGGTGFMSRKNSSVDAVVAPAWQDSANSAQMEAKRRKQLLEAIGKKNDWGVDPAEEYLKKADLGSLDMAAETYLSSDKGTRTSRDLAEQVFYGNRKKSESKVERSKKDVLSDFEKFSANNEKKTGSQLLEEGGIATPSYYQQNFDNLFRPGDLLQNDRGPEALTKISEREATGAALIGMGHLIPDQISQNNPSNSRLENFRNMMGIPTEGNASSALNLSSTGGGAAGNGLLGNFDAPTAGNSLTSGGRLDGSSLLGGGASLDSLNATRSMTVGGPLDFGNSGLAPSTLGSGGFDPLPRNAAPSLQQQPLFFEVPKRTF